MNLALNITSTLEYRLGDNPTIEGTIVATDSTLSAIAVLMFIDSTIGPVIDNKSVTYWNKTTGEFTYIYPTALNTTYEGKISAVCLVDSGHSGLLESGVTSAANQTVDITTEDEVRSAGWCKIGDEICLYTLSGNTVTLTERGLFGTTAVAHVVNDAIEFSYSLQTAVPRFEYEVLERTT